MSHSMAVLLRHNGASDQDALQSYMPDYIPSAGVVGPLSTRTLLILLGVQLRLYAFWYCSGIRLRIILFLLCAKTGPSCRTVLM